MSNLIASDTRAANTQFKAVLDGVGSITTAVWSVVDVYCIKA